MKPRYTVKIKTTGVFYIEDPMGPSFKASPRKHPAFAVDGNVTVFYANYTFNKSGQFNYFLLK